METNPGMQLAKEIGVNVDQLYNTLGIVEQNNALDTVILKPEEAKFLRACIEVACGY